MALSSLIGLVLSAQVQSAAVTGVVRDRATREPLSGAVILLTDLDRAVLADAYGRYVIRGVPAGPHHVRYQRIGYAARTIHALVPGAGELAIDVALNSQPIALDPLEVRPRVPVPAHPPADSSTWADRSISIAAVRQHPLLSEPDVFRALSSGLANMKPESPSGIYLQGGTGDQTAYLLDGIPVFSPYHAAGIFSAWNPDALARIDVFATAPPATQPDALSGVIAGTTRTPASRFQAQGSVSTTQARVTLDGPLGTRGAGYLLALRSGFGTLFAPDSDPSYARSETADVLLKLDAPLLGGRVHVLGLQSDDEIDAAATAESPDSPDSPAADARNVFEWENRSLGVTWARTFGATTLRLQGWSAHGRSAALWAAAAGGRDHLGAGRSDDGFMAMAQRTHRMGASAFGLRLGSTRTHYAVATDSGDARWAARSQALVTSVFGEHHRRMGETAELGLALSLAAFDGDMHVSPRARLAWRPASTLALSVSLAKLHQFAQSLRNPESVVGSIFPADLYVSAGAAGVPVAAATQASLSAEYRPRAGLRLGVEAYARELDALVLVAPRDGEPFVTHAFAAGTGTASGASFDASLSTARFAILAGYRWQRVRLEFGDTAYSPDHGASHAAEAGVTFFPTATWSIRLGSVALGGRRTTEVPGTLEWETCNLRDLGCEFAGSPHYGRTPVGAVALPAYFRVDLGVRHHWHLHLPGRDATIALFGTVSNVVGRQNVMTYAANTAAGRMPIEMLPRGPLVMGIDWRF